MSSNQALVPWKGLGHKVLSNDINDAINKAGLNWEVGEEECETVNSKLRVPNRKVLYRKDNKRVLGVVGKNYPVYSNSQMFDWFEPFMQTDRLIIDSAGELNGGERIWVFAKFKDSGVSIGRGNVNDSVDKYILASNAFNGSNSIRFALTPFRLSCYNMFPGILRSSFASIRHSGQALRRVNEAQSVLDQATQQFNRVAQTFTQLAEKPYTEEKLNVYLKKCMNLDPYGKEEDIKTRTLNTLNQIKGYVVNSPGNTPEIASTWWGAYNAMTYYYTHEYGRSANSRLNSLWFGVNSGKVKKALDLAVEMSVAA